VFAVNGAGLPSPEIARVKATPIDTTGSILWSYASGATSVVPPSVGADAIYTTDNLGVVHAMTRGTGAGAGEWPRLWNPLAGGQAHPESLGGDPGHDRLAAAARDGRRRRARGRRPLGNARLVAERGVRHGACRASAASRRNRPLCSRASAATTTCCSWAPTTAPSNTFHALDLATGNTQDVPYPNGLMGNVMGQAVVDYARTASSS
jgi:hypothetical protein